MTLDEFEKILPSLGLAPSETDYISKLIAVARAAEKLEAENEIMREALDKIIRLGHNHKMGKGRQKDCGACLCAEALEKLKD